jgi:hypothetical protein
LVAVLVSVFRNPPLTSEEIALVGTWVCSDSSIIECGWMCLFVFEEDGRFVDRDGDGGRFSIEDGWLVLRFDEYEEVALTFNLVGDTLILADGAATLRRKGSSGEGV